MLLTKFGYGQRSVVQQVSYRTEFREYETYVVTDISLCMVLSGDVMKEQWDKILVDSPHGDPGKLRDWRFLHPGRMHPIYMSTKLANHRTHICIHDWDREAEAY